MRCRLLSDEKDRETKAVAITGWVVIVGILGAWLAFGTVCIIYVIGQFLQ